VVEIPAFVRQKLDEPTFWQFVTINQDGSPAVTPVWIDTDGKHILVNTAVGRRKERNVRRDPRVALGFVDRDDPYTWIEVRGRVVEFVEGEEADASIDRLSNRYLGLDRYASRSPGERRVLLRIEPTFITFRTEAGSRPDRLRAKLAEGSADER
jgi:PPOX class probable F420-dependent enzyme